VRVPDLDWPVDLFTDVITISPESIVMLAPNACAQYRHDRPPGRSSVAASTRRDDRVDHAAAASIMRDAFSPIMIDGALVLPEVNVGMIEASATRNPSIPCTRS
jgi:hypothetical protein